MKILQIYTAIMLIALVAPIAVIVVASVTSAEHVTFPPIGFSLRWYEEFFANEDFVQSARTSFEVAFATCLAAGSIGSLAALAFAKYRFPGRRDLETLLTLPFSIPSLVLALAFLMLYTTMGFSGTKLSLIVAHTMLTTPFVMRLVTANFSNFNWNVEAAAAGLGASPFRVFWYVTLPLVLPGVLGGMIFAFVVSFDEVVIALFLSGPDAVTLPVRIFNYLDQSPGPIVVAAGSVLVFFALFLMVLLEWTVKIGRAFGIDDR